jgi:hypothetical protein
MGLHVHRVSDQLSLCVFCRDVLIVQVTREENYSRIISRQDERRAHDLLSIVLSVDMIKHHHPPNQRRRRTNVNW